MFVLHTSNQTENLLAHLVSVLDRPLSSPLLTEQFLIQSQGMQRWLSQQLAEQKGVWANFEFHFPGKFFGNIVDQVNQGEANELYSQEQLVWHFDDLLRDLDGDEFRVLEQYLEADNTDLKRFQLSQKLAYLFDQYQFMRPDWLTEWERGQRCLKDDAEIWQAALWKALHHRHGNQSKGHLWLSTIKRFRELDPDTARSMLPERLLVFGINAMSPVYLHFLQVVSEFIEVHFFLLNPSKQYWADTPSSKQLAKLIAAQDESLLQEGVNPLLSALGQQGRDFQKLLLSDLEFEFEVPSFDPVSSNTVLSQLQNDILDNSVTNKALSVDNSLSFHSCHSRMRETEVIKDQLLKCLDEDKSLSLRDIVVMTPDIQKYTPYISAVFADIPHAIADRTLLDSNDALSVMLRFLSLSQNRWELESVLDVLEQAVVYQKFGLVESDLEVIRTWLTNTEVRWGESAEHRAELGFAAFSENSWRAALDRMLMGYANSNDQAFVEGVLPFADIEGSQAQILGCLYEFFTLLSATKQRFSTGHTLEYWQKHLTELAEKLLENSDEFQHQYAQLMQMLIDLGKNQAIHNHRLPLDVVLGWLNSEAASQQSASGFLRGQLTFCSMLPMRAIPFKVIALMGLNEGEYPRVDNRTAFDLMATDFRKGDKSPRADERYQFLEVLLSTQQQLLVSFIGQSLKTNEALPPSILVSELLELLQNHYQLKKEDLVHSHPLHAFSRQYFGESEQFFTYSSHQHAIAKALHTREIADKQSWWQGEIEQQAETVIDLQDLLDFYKHPQRYFLQNQLKIRVPSVQQSADETEPFTLEGLSQYLIHQEWVERHLSGESDDELFYQQLMAQGRWLNGANGKIVFAEHQGEIHSFVDHIHQQQTGSAIDPIAVDMKVGGYRIVGSLDHQYDNGMLFYRFANLKGKDLVAAWLAHLFAQSVRPAKTWLLAKDQQWCFQATPNPESALLPLVEHYLEGRKAPSRLIIEAVHAWQEQKAKDNGKLRKSPLDMAATELKKLVEWEAELQLLYQHDTIDSVLNAEFEAACELLTPIWIHREPIDG